MTEDNNYSSVQQWHKRIDNLINIISRVSINPLSTDPETGEINYEIKFRCLNQLQQEFLGIATEEEKKKLKEIKQMINTHKRVAPIFKKSRKYKNQHFSPEGTTINKDNWKMREDLLDLYQEILMNINSRLNKDSDESTKTGFENE